MAKKLTGPEKTAILLMTLGEDTAAEVMKALHPKEIRKIGNTISKLSEVPEEDVTTVFVEFAEHAAKSGGLSVDAKDYLPNVLTKALGKDKAKRVLETLTAIEDSGIESLKWMDPKSIATLIRHEHPQTIALILTHLEPDQGSHIVRNLPEAMRSDVVLRMATLEEIPPGVMHDVNEVLQTEISRVGSTSGTKVGGVKLAAKLLNNMDHTAEQAVLASISQQSPDLAEQIRKLMFVFDDLINLDDRAMQQVLKDVAKDQLAIALKAAKEDVKEKFYKNMSERAVQILKEDMEARGPVKLSDVEKAQQGILAVAQKLAEEGKIVIGGKGGETDVMV